MRNGKTTQGKGVDSEGKPVIDPTENVIALVEAANIRQDDLRKVSEQLSLERFQHMREMMRLHARYESKLSLAESKRIDAIRSVDVQAFQMQTERAAQNADALRNLVTTTASTLAGQQRQQSEEINKRLAAIEKLQYEGQGKSSQTDPLLADLVQEIKHLRSESSQTQGRGGGMKDLVGWIVGAVMFIISVIVFVINYMQ
jgi:DNA anti-recombination protein RmuC